MTTSGSPPAEKAPPNEAELPETPESVHHMNHDGGSCGEAVARSKYDSVWMGGVRSQLRHSF